MLLLFSLTLCFFSLGCTGSTVSNPLTEEFVGKPAAPSDPSPTSHAPPTQHGALWYRIEAKEDSLRLGLRLLNPPRQVTFFFPGPWAGRADFDQQIVLGHARGPQGPLPLAVDRSLGRIDIDTDDAPWIELNYRVRTRLGPTEEHRFHPWANEEAFFAYAPTILILPSAGLAEQLRDIPVEIRTPQDWTVATTWPMAQSRTLEDGSNVAGFIVDDVRSLRDAFIGAGTAWSSHHRRLQSGELRLTLAGEFALDEEALMEATAIIVDNYLERFGIFEQLSGVILPTTADAPSSLRGMGRRGGFILEIAEDQPLDAELLLLLAHEVFHSWNGHQLVPAVESDGDLRWFKEGVTHYVALKTLGQLGLIDARRIRAELARAGQFYQQNPLIAGGTVRPVDRARLPYDRGLLIALALDLKLTGQSDCRVGIEDWIVTLLSPAFLERSRAYDEALLRESFMDFATIFDARSHAYFDELVDKRTRLDVVEIFSELGLHYLNPGDGQPARALPFDGAPNFERIFSTCHNGSLP